MNLNINKIYYWCDSTIVLLWIRTHPGRWQTYVASRVAEIQRLSNPDDWQHVISNENSADLVTRGVQPEHLIDMKLWWNEPAWLMSNSSFDPFADSEIIENLPEGKRNKTICHIINVNSVFPITNFASLLKLKRVLAYCFRFIKNCRQLKNERKTGSLTVSEIKYAFCKLVRVVQQNSFPEEYKSLSNGDIISKGSRLLSLTPFLDTDGVMRVGGRIKFSDFCFDKKHPILLPDKHLTKLLITCTQALS